jgi:hypothetical protein
MTIKQAHKLIPNVSYIRYAGQWFPFVRLEKCFGATFVVIRDEPNHEDMLKVGSVSISAKEPT